MAAPVKSAAIGFIFVTLLLDTTGFGLVIPVFPKLIQQLAHTDLSKASQYGGWLVTCYALMQFVFAPVLGNLSDRFGRRPVLLFSLLGFGLDYAFSRVWPFAGLAVCRKKPDRRDYRGEFHDRIGVHCRHQYPGKPGPEFWDDRGGFWSGIHHWAFAWRITRWLWPETALFCGGGVQFTKYFIRLFCPARIPLQG